MASERRQLRQPGDAAGSRSEETTQSDEEWPVPDLYVVEPDPELAENGSEEVTDAERGALVVSEPRRLRARRGLIAGSLAAAVLLLLLAGAVVAVAFRDEEASSARPQATSTNPATTTSKSLTTPNSQASIEVPNAVGLEAAEARSILGEAGLRVRTRAIESQRPEGIVTAQSPESGATVAPDTRVLLSVSSGAAQVTIPDVVGLDVSSAKDELRAAGLRHEVRLMRTEKPAGTVLDQQPAAGTKADPESVVRIEVTRGVPKVVVPPLVGSWSSVAQRRLRQLGLRWTTSELASPKPKGMVIGQSPSGGTQVEKGQTVTLEISTVPAGVAVPDVTGLDEQSARQELETAGFEVRVRSEPTGDPSQDGVVTGQNPASGVKAKEGSTVTLTVARLS